MSKSIIYLALLVLLTLPVWGDFIDDDDDEFDALFESTPEELERL